MQWSLECTGEQKQKTSPSAQSPTTVLAVSTRLIKQRFLNHVCASLACPKVFWNAVRILHESLNNNGAQTQCMLTEICKSQTALFISSKLTTTNDTCHSCCETFKAFHNTMSNVLQDDLVELCNHDYEREELLEIRWRQNLTLEHWLRVVKLQRFQVLQKNTVGTPLNATEEH